MRSAEALVEGDSLERDGDRHLTGDAKAALAENVGQCNLVHGLEQSGAQDAVYRDRRVQHHGGHIVLVHRFPHAEIPARIEGRRKSERDLTVG